jgi:hypothetical protein
VYNLPRKRDHRHSPKVISLKRKNIAYYLFSYSQQIFLSSEVELTSTNTWLIYLMLNSLTILLPRSFPILPLPLEFERIKNYQNSTKTL